MARALGAPRFTPAIACESFIEVQAQILEVRAFVTDEMRRSWERGHDTTRMRQLQRADAAIRAIDIEAKRAAAWAESAIEQKPRKVVAA